MILLFKTWKDLLCINEGEDKQAMYFLVKEQKRDIRMLEKTDSCYYLQIKQDSGERKECYRMFVTLYQFLQPQIDGDLREYLTSKNLTVHEL